MSRIATKNDLYKELWLRERDAGEIVWKTKVGDTLKLKDLSTSHIKNILNMMEESDMMEDIAADFKAEEYGLK